MEPRAPLIAAEPELAREIALAERGVADRRRDILRQTEALAELEQLRLMAEDSSEHVEIRSIRLLLGKIGQTLQEVERTASLLGGTPPAAMPWWLE